MLRACHRLGVRYLSLSLSLNTHWADSSGTGEPDAQQLKYYARGTGNVRVGWRGSGEKTQETLELVRVDRLDAAALAAVRAEALKLEQSGYRHSPTVYAHTPPAEGVTRQ